MQIKGKGRGKNAPNRSRGKGKGAAGPAQAPPPAGSGDRMLPPNWKKLLKNRTEDGREICFNYQKDACSGACGRVHICHFCGAKHPLSWHTKPPGSSGDASGPRQASGDAAGSRRRFR